VQFEFPWALGPDDGRYILRGHAGEPSHVIVTRTLGAEQRWLRRRRRSKAAAPLPEPAPVLTTRATVIGATPFTAAATAEDWLRRADLQEHADTAVGVLNHLLHAYRTTTANPYVREVAYDQALTVRVGVGDGDQVADGRWSDARELEERRVRVSRAAAMLPQERLAALLAGRDAALACEELSLRARLDLDQGRLREAALQLRVALEAAIAELQPWIEQATMADRLATLREERGPVGRAANAALEGGLDEATTEDVRRVLGELEAALRARTAEAVE
jgi:hypothetical protein